MGNEWRGSEQKYYNTIRSIAEDIKDEYKSYGTDVHDQVFERADSLVIYYSDSLDILQISRNQDAISDVGAELDMSEGPWGVITQMAFYAAEQDIWDALGDLGFEGEGFDEEEEEEDGQEKIGWRRNTTATKTTNNWYAIEDLGDTLDDCDGVTGPFTTAEEAVYWARQHSHGASVRRLGDDGYLYVD